ncbi:MAG TPA: DUF5677 domain-containing protein [Thermoanaerobaculia bacterium]|nr:DUF5677 domain-containing protein [Thermoanaerobaculia bacterium]
MVVTLRHRGIDDVPSRLVLAFVTKAAQTGRGIVVLYERELYHEAQSLVRVIFEINVSFAHFLRMLSQDPKMACKRVIDSMMLEKIKQQRASGFMGLGLIEDGPTPEDFEAQDAEIAKRYTADEIRAMRKHGFTGLSVEERAKQAGRGDLYQIVYRNFSRNVHGFDYMELLLAEQPSLIGDERCRAYIESRNGTALDVAFGCLGYVVEAVNTAFELGLDARFAQLVKDRQRARERDVER